MMKLFLYYFLIILLITTKIHSQPVDISKEDFEKLEI